MVTHIDNTRLKPQETDTFGGLLFILLLLGLTVFSSCTEEPHIEEINYDELELAHFVEPDFPFITTSLDANDLGTGYPDANIAPRCLAIQLGNEAYTCFDTDMLRWSVAWTGDFLPMVSMAQISYDDFFNKDNLIPHISGEPSIATGQYPGWEGAEPVFTDPRGPSPNPVDPPFGPIPADEGRFGGVYLQGDDVVLTYTALNTTIYEMPGSIMAGDQTGFTRAIRIDELNEALSMTAAEVTNVNRTEMTDQMIVLYQGAGEDSVTAVGLTGVSGDAELEVHDERYVTVHLPAGQQDLSYTVVSWNGPANSLSQFEQMLAEPVEFPDFRNGGPARWEEVIKTRGQVAPDTAAYVIDQLTLPLPNPWNRNVRVTDVAFFEEGRAAVSTFEGDIWIVDGIDEQLNSLSWHRFASGLYEPQSIELVDGMIYTFGKEGIIRFHDLNGDGEADYYENFSNLMQQSMETREWAADMAADPAGGFYVAKAGALDMGPRAYSSPVISGFRGGSHHSGSILKVSEDGRSVELYATGFRGPYIGIHPETGVLTASDQQGHFMPSTPILMVNEGDYYGVTATAHRDPVPSEITPPLTWIPHNVDQSASSQVWITSDRMGELSGGLVHLSYGRPGLFRVLMDSSSSAIHGAVTMIPGNYPAPTNKGAIHPGDGQLYVTGFNLWGSRSTGYSTFFRLRYTGMTSYIASDFMVRDGGVVIRFDTELDEESVTNTSSYQVERWNYQRSGEYGSGHYNLDGSPGEEILPVFSAHLSEDGRSVFLTIPNIEEVMQMQVSYQISAADGTGMEDAIYFSVKATDPIDLAASGFPGLDLDELLVSGSGDTMGSSDVPVSADRGQTLFQRTGCIGCHSVDGSTDGFAGPTLQGVFGSERQFSDGSSAIADEEYLRSSILQPNDQIVEGFDEGMPPFLGILSDGDIESIILYIRSLEE